MSQYRTPFLIAWVIAFASILVVVILANYIVDPYLFFNSPRVHGFNARKPIVDSKQRMMKTFELKSIRPRSLILGSSRVEIGINALDEHWPPLDARQD